MMTKELDYLVILYHRRSQEERWPPDRNLHLAILQWQASYHQPTNC